MNIRLRTRSWRDLVTFHGRMITVDSLSPSALALEVRKKIREETAVIIGTPTTREVSASEERSDEQKGRVYYMMGVVTRCFMSSDSAF